MKIANLFTLSLSSLIACCLFTACTKDNNTPVVVRKPPVVNAGLSQTITFPVDSVSLTGSVTDSGSKVVSYLWSEVSGPNVPVINAEGSLSTKIHGLTVGSYIFQLTATDTFGLTGVDTLMITVNPPTSITLISNGNNSSAVEYVGNSGIDDTNGGGAIPEVGAEAWTIGGTTVFVRSVFRFDLSTLPALPIKSAKLTLYSNPTPYTANLSTPNFGTGNAMYIQRVSSNWNAVGATWATQPAADAAGQVSIPQTNASTLDLVNVDVTTLVNNMITSGNYGFMIRLQNEVIYNSRIFCSGNYSDASKHPVLVINY
jgi:hypothetical protein